jgi:peroxiredoxin
MLGVGDRIPEVTVWTPQRRPVSLASILESGPALLVFYLFDFSST